MWAWLTKTKIPKHIFVKSSKNNVDLFVIPRQASKNQKSRYGETKHHLKKVIFSFFFMNVMTEV